MAKTDDKPKAYPPIIPLSTLTGFIETLKNTVVPPVIDGSLLTKMSGSTRSSLMSAMRFCGLVNSAGVVEKKLHALVKAYGTADWKQALCDELMPAFSEIVHDINLDGGTAAQLENAFRTRGGVDGQMLEKSVRFYLLLLTEAGVPYSPHFKSRTIRKPSVKRKPKGRTVIDELDDPDDDPRDDEDGEIEFDAETSARFVIPIPDKGNATIVIPKAIDVDDWEMVKVMLNAYVSRLVKAGSGSV